MYYWNTDTFHNRYEMMKELFDKYSDDDYDIFVTFFLLKIKKI